MIKLTENVIYVKIYMWRGDFMELNTKSYVEYKSQIDEYWQDQVFAGAMFGRANLREVSLAFKNIKERIEQDTNLSQNIKTSF